MELDSGVWDGGNKHLLWDLSESRVIALSLLSGLHNKSQNVLE